jgi:hypothetical protein
MSYRFTTMSELAVHLGRTVSTDVPAACGS